MNNTLNFYEILGVSKNASKEEIISAYKKQMKHWHPDVNKEENAIDMSSKINEAKEVLLDDDKRRDYDDYLSQKISDSYQRYTNIRRQNSYQENEYEQKMVSKWQYFSEWLKKSNASKLKKGFACIGVALESALVFLIRITIIIVAFICNIVSDIIRSLFAYLAPIFGIIVLFFAISILMKGVKETLTTNKEITQGIIIFSLVFVSSFILPILSNYLLSEKTFNYLYNTIDINLFKKCVGYKN